jgi:peptidoglycan/xylan/chitin deacetylase (PgdA/CDA1 family)
MALAIALMLAVLPNRLGLAEEPSPALAACEEASGAGMHETAAFAAAAEEPGPAILAAEQPTLLYIGSMALASVGAGIMAEAKPRLPRTADMPILIYHHVVPGVRAESAAARALFVTPAEFERQLTFLKDNGYRSVSFADLAAHLEGGAELPDRPVIISFDDGWDNQFAYGFPLLQKYHFTATFFVVTDYLDRPNFMTTEQLKEMLDAGMEIGSHSRSHPALPGLGAARLWNEIAGSKKVLEDRLGVAIDTFAYPYGAYNSAVAAATRGAGYRSARTVDFGTHYTVKDLATLAGVTFSMYMNSYRGRVELTAGQASR